jgi:hypothetical protein
MFFVLSALVSAACKISGPDSVSVPVTVTFSGNGHTGGMVALLALLGPAGLPMPVQGSLVKTGCTFRGWNTQANGSGTDYIAGASYAFAADTTLYAKWKVDWIGIAGTASTFGSSTIMGIDWGGGKFVAAGEGGKMAWSTDGVTWTGIDGTGSTFGASNIRGIAWGDGKFIAVGEGGKMAKSIDGVAWAVIDTTSAFFGAPIIGIAYGGGTFVAGGGAGRIARSGNGETWTGINGTASTFDSFDIHGIAYGEGTFVAGGHDGKMAWHEYP